MGKQCPVGPFPFDFEAWNRYRETPIDDGDQPCCDVIDAFKNVNKAGVHIC